MTSLLRAMARRLSLATQSIPALHRWLKSVFLSLPPKVRGRQMIWDALCELAKRHPHLTILQIGANDGDFNDPVAQLIRRHGWTGLLVEPVPFIFERLQTNYVGQHGIALANVAVSDHDGTQEFYYLDVREGVLPVWCIGVGSFLKDDVVRSCPSAVHVSDYLRTINVPCRTVATLLAEYQITTLDVVVIDAQGYDARIVVQLPLDQIRPSIVIYEHHLLEERKRQHCDEFLRSHGYVLESDKWDTLAILKT